MLWVLSARTRTGKFLFIILLLVLSVFLNACPQSARATRELPNLNDIVLSKENLLEHIAFLSNLNSRMTGYPCCQLAAEYIKQRFRDYGLKVSTHEYRVLVPVEKQVSIEVILNGHVERVIKGYALYPNLIQTCSTPPEGISGKLIFAGNDLKELDGKEVEGNIVLLDFNTGADWINLVGLGAKAVIFMESHFTNRIESMSKILQTPVHFPRVYITWDDGLYLKGALNDNVDLEVRVISRMKYEWVEAENIIGMINGTEEPNDVIIVSSHYDSWSAVPSKSPAADEATGVAALIELAKYFSDHPPRRSIWFVAFSGHWQGLAGAREFVEDTFFSEEVQKGALRIWMTMNLDFSTGSDSLSVVHTSHFYKFNAPLSWENRFKMLLRNYIKELEAETGTDFSKLIFLGVRQEGWWARIPLPYIIDSDPMVITGSIAFTLRTEDSRFFWCTPLNDLHKVNLDNLMTQLRVAHYILLRFVNEIDWGISWESIAPRKFSFESTPAGIAGSGFVTLHGRVVEYNVTTGWLEPIPYALITARNSLTTYPFSTIITKADSYGRFSIKGTLPSFLTNPQNSYEIEAWVLDDHNDHIKYAPNLGLYGENINVPLSILNSPANTTVAVFRCKSVVLLDVYDPKNFMKSIVPDKRDSEGSLYNQPIKIRPYDFTTGSTCLWYGYYYRGDEPVAIIFVPPEERFMIKIDYGTPVVSSVFLVNSSSEQPEGCSYTFKRRDVIYISIPNQAALDMYRVTKARYSKLGEFLLRDPSLEEYIRAAEKHLIAYLDYRNSNMHSKARGEVLAAWSSSVMAYELLMNLIHSSSITITYVVALIVPAALFVDRLLSSSSGYKRLLFILFLMAFMFLFFRIFFPGFNVLEIRGNPLMLTIAIPLLYMLLFSTFIFFRTSLAALKRMKKEKLGVHEIEREEEFSFMLHGITVSIRYMKRRRLRTLFTLILIVTTTLSMTSLSSISPYLSTRQVPLFSVHSPYNGFLFKTYDSSTFEVLDEPILDFLENIFVARSLGEICPRVWVYPQVVIPEGDLVSDVHSKYSSSRINALMGLSAYEASLLFEGSLIEGFNLQERDAFSCLISKSQSEALNVTVSDAIFWCGVKFVVKGIFDEKLVGGLYDIDGLLMTPFDPSTVEMIYRMPVEEGAMPEPLGLSDLIIIPYETALKLGGSLVSVACHINNNMENISEVIDEISPLNINVFIGVNGSTYSLSRTTLYAFSGLEPIILLAVLASMNIFNTMLRIIYERKGEVMVHSALGLDPRSSALLFFFEMLVYSVTGITVGYLVGININYLLITFHVLPEGFIFNYSSSTVLFVILAVLTFTLLSTIYPAFIASKIVTPSHERKWKIPTKPKDGEWEIPLPFVASKEEVRGIFNFIREYYENVSEDQLKTFAFREEIEINLSSENPFLKSIVTLAPYQLNITQLFYLIAIPIRAGDQYTFQIRLKKLTGFESRTTWVSSNYRFIDSIRVQFLIWRSFSENEKRKYYS